MTTLADEQCEFEKEHSRTRTLIPVDKDQLASAFLAAYNWFDANVVSFNLALPEAFRTAATDVQKARLLQSAARVWWQERS